jgi:ribosomal protein S18 acetylase RimI-like enzyme
VAGHVLDNPVWHALATQHAGLALTADGAARYPTDIVPFAAVGEASARAADQLTSLIDDAESVFVVGVAPEPPPGWQLEPQRPVLQMVCTARAPEVPGPPVTGLGAEHVPDMVALTDLVFPGFFRPRTLEMGAYYVIYRGTRLAAMAGERMRPAGCTEVSGVCTHPDFRGRGLARRLSAAVAAAIQARGETPFLHAWRSNHAAIALYEGLGFVLRTEMNVVVLERGA